MDFTQFTSRLHHWRTSYPFRFYGALSMLTLGLLAVIAVVSLLSYVNGGGAGRMPDRQALLNFRNDVGSEAFDRNGRPLGRFFAEDRTNCEYKDLPAHLVRALVVTEDARFYEHGGIDWPAYGRVFYKTILKGQDDQGGGSTLTQQLVKNAYGRQPLGHHPYVDMGLHKIREALLARRMEKVMTKEQVIERYLNTVAFPANTYGIVAASRRFFQKKPAELTPREAACLVATLKATTLYDPRLAPERNKARADRTLRLMADAGYLSSEELKTCLADTLKLNYHRESAYAGLAPHFTDAVRVRAQQILDGIRHPDRSDSWNLYTDNLRVHTSLDLGYQAHAEAALVGQLADHQKAFEAHLGQRNPWETDASLRAAIRSSKRWRNGQKRGLDSLGLLEDFARKIPMELPVPNGEPLVGEFSPLDSVAHHLRQMRAGFLVLDHSSGAVRSWVGGPDFSFSRYDHVTAKRQTGSTFKPFVYAAAVRQGYSPCHPLSNEEKTYGTGEMAWTPRNSNREYGGEYSMHGALSHSVNTAAVRMTLETGADKIIDFAREVGIDSDLSTNPGISLGIDEGTLFDMVGAYGVFANAGQFNEPYFIERILTADGEVVYEHKAAAKRVLSETEAALMNQMLRYVVERGTAGRLSWQYGVSRPSTGKTGTTQNMADGWYLGSTPNLTGGAWVGGENPGVRFRSGGRGNGSRSALPIWADFLKRMEKDTALVAEIGVDFPPLPARVLAEFYCPEFTPPEDELLQQAFGEEALEHMVPVNNLGSLPGGE